MTTIANAPLCHAEILEISLTIITRRNFLAGAGTCSLSPVIPFTRWSGSHTEMGEAIVANEYELLHGCIFARMDGKRSSSGDAFTAPSIDFWTFRVSEIESSNVESCGVSRIDWPDVLPHLRNSYDLIIGFAHFVGRGPSHRLELCDGPFDNSRIANTLACCDLSFWTSDALLGFHEELAYEARAPVLTTLVHDLIHVLSATDLVRTLAGTPEAPKLFASTLRPQGPLGNFSVNIGYGENGALLIDGSIVL